MCEDYSDSLRRAYQCLYEPALAMMESGAYAAAAEMFEKVIN